MSERCPKCGRVKTQHDSSQEECPECGIRYKSFRHEKSAKSQIGEDNKHPKTGDLESQIQDEIRRQVLEHEQTRREEEQRQLQTQATLEALEEITEVPYEESVKIAQQVRVKYTLKHKYHVAKSLARRTMIRFGLIVLGILLLIIGISRSYNHWRYSKITYKAVFTTGLNGYNEPVNDLREVSITADRIYLYVSWQHLPKGRHDYHIRIFDESDSLIWEHTMEFRATESYNTWSWYRPKKTMDLPGRWRFEVFLDGKKVLEEYLLVISK